jgi:hypothetical protein
MNPIAWLESGVLKGLLVAGAGLVGVILSFFGVDEALFNKDAARLIDALSTLLAAAGVVYAAYARATKPNPPITEGAANKQAVRIEEEKRLVRSPWLVGLLTVVLVLVTLLSGCATWNQHKDVAQLGITYGTLKFVEKPATPKRRQCARRRCA